MKKFLLLGVLAFVFVTAGSAHAIEVGVFGELDNWVTSAQQLSGTGGEYAGVDPVAALIGDDLTDGAINIDDSNSFLLNFAGITNGDGADFVIFDGRFSSDGVFLTINGLQREILPEAFIDSGLNLILKNAGLGFDLYGALLDLNDWGIGSGDTIYSMVLTGRLQSDIMGVSGIGSAAVPIPGAIWLLGAGLFGLAGLKRRLGR